MTGLPGRHDAVWWAGLVVAAAAAAATAHGLYAVAEASDVPRPVAVLYPIITDGLALVAYSATNRLDGAARRYAWAVVVAAAGLSGAAQAAYLTGGGVHAAPAGVRFGIGAAPAVAAAAVAHLLHLIKRAGVQPEAPADRPSRGVQPPPVQLDPVRDSRPSVDRSTSRTTGGTGGGAAARAHRTAERYRVDRGQLPTASELVQLTGVSRGTAGTVLKGLRSSRPQPDLSEPEPSQHTAPAPLPNDTESAHLDHPTHPASKINTDHTPMHHDPQDGLYRAEVSADR